MFDMNCEHTMTRPSVHKGSSADAPSATAAPANESQKPALPHERDEKAGATGGTPSRRVQQGARDLAHGMSDTSGAPEADAAYRKLKKA